MRRVLRSAVLGSIVMLAWAAPAHASQLIARSAAHPTLKVSPHGVAVVSWTDPHGRAHHALAWGAIGARWPNPDLAQVRFRIDYSGGFGSFGTGYWKRVRNACTRYTGPPLSHLVFACDGRDGSYWALQTWRRMLRDGGWPTSSVRGAKELHLSHWRGAVPDLFVDTDWIYNGRFDHVFGYLRWAGKPVYGFEATPGGNPLDGYGRNLYVDVHDPAWGAGWYRFNSGLLHRPDGVFCMGMYALYGRSAPAKGDAYRATVMGPGVTPIVDWQGSAPGPYNQSLDLQKNAEQRSFTNPGDTCWNTH
jgi:hypothetical protein